MHWYNPCLLRQSTKEPLSEKLAEVQSLPVTWLWRSNTTQTCGEREHFIALVYLLLPNGMSVISLNVEWVRLISRWLSAVYWISHYNSPDHFISMKRFTGFICTYGIWVSWTLETVLYTYLHVGCQTCIEKCVNYSWHKGFDNFSWMFKGEEESYILQTVWMHY